MFSCAHHVKTILKELVTKKFFLLHIYVILINQIVALWIRFTLLSSRVSVQATFSSHLISRNVVIIKGYDFLYCDPLFQKCQFLQKCHLKSGNIMFLSMITTNFTFISCLVSSSMSSIIMSFNLCQD